MESEDISYTAPLSGGQVSPKPISKFKRAIRTLLVIFILGLIFSVYWFFFNKYSDGERTGVLIKISRKGNIFKTNEGEMWLSCRQMTNPEKFYFSISSDSIVNVLKGLQDECVQVTYSQYRASLPWRGDSKYLVTGVMPVKKD